MVVVTEDVVLIEGVVVVRVSGRWKRCDRSVEGAGGEHGSIQFGCDFLSLEDLSSLKHLMWNVEWRYTWQLVHCTLEVDRFFLKMGQI